MAIVKISLHFIFKCIFLGFYIFAIIGRLTMKSCTCQLFSLISKFTIFYHAPPSLTINDIFLQPLSKYFMNPLIGGSLRHKGLIRYHTLSMQEGGPEGFTNFPKKCSQPSKTQTYIFQGPLIFSENISWPLPSILVSYLSLTCSSISGQCSVIFKFKIIKEVDIHNNIKKIIS